MRLSRSGDLGAEDQGGTCLCDVGGDPNLWVVYLDDQVDGFILIYVDDFLIMMSLIGLQDVLDAITSKWEISTPEMINEKTSVKYLAWS